MSKMVHTTHTNDADKAHAAKQSVRTTKTHINNETIINSITGYDNNFAKQLEQMEREAEIQARQIELGECLNYVAQIVDFFKNTVILSELHCQNDMHNDTQCHPRGQMERIGSRDLEDKVEKIVMSKGLTKEQWNNLLCLAVNTGNGTKLTKVNKKYLHKVHDMVSRLLEGEEQTAVFALINTIDKYMSNNHFPEK
jgi:hypothetical protein